jgi:hypothetical protein
MADPKWTVSIIFQNYDDDDTVYYNYLKEDIENVESDKDLQGLVKFFVLRHDEKIKKAVQLTIDETGKLSPFGEVFDVPKFYTDPTFEKARSVWTDFLKKAAGFKCDHFLMTHGHGSGLAFSTRARENIRDNNDPAENFVTQLQVIFSHNIIQNYSNDVVNENIRRYLSEKFVSPQIHARDFSSVTIDVIPVNILKTAVSEAFNNEKIAFLYLGNCFMQTIENGYLFRNTASYLAACEGFYRPSGTDFKKLFATMAKNDGPVSYEVIANTICENIPQKLSDPRIIEHLGENIVENIRNSFSFSVNKLSRYCELKTQISLLGGMLLNGKPDTFNEIVKIREDIRMSTDVWLANPLGITDFLLFGKNVALIQEWKELDRKIYHKIREIITIFNDCVAARYFPFKSFDPTSASGTNVNPNGASIFLPRMKPSHNEQNENLKHFMEKYYIDDKYISDFLKENLWRQFVIDYYYYKNPGNLATRIANFLKRFF